MDWECIPIRYFVLDNNFVYYRVLPTKKETVIDRKIIRHLVIDTHKVGSRIIGYVIKSKRKADIITGEEYVGVYYNRRIDLEVCYTSIYKNKNIEVYSDSKNFFITKSCRNYTESDNF